MSDFKALRDELQGLLEGSLPVRLDVVIGGRDARTLIGQQKSLDALAFFARNSDAILAALDLADKAGGYREALERQRKFLDLVDTSRPLQYAIAMNQARADIDQTLQGDDNGQS